jgi:hypothetical protein
MKTGHKLAAAVAVLPLSLLMLRITGSAWWLLGLPFSFCAGWLYVSDLHAELVRATDMKVWSWRRLLLQLPQYIAATVLVLGGVAGLAWLLWTLWQGGDIGLKHGLIGLAGAVIAILGGVGMFVQGIRGPPPTVKEWFTVSFDDTQVRIRARPPREPAVDASFAWASIVRVIFQDGGIGGSDVFFIFTDTAENAFVVLTEGEGGSEFFGALCGRGYFPPEISAQAIRSSDGGCYVWPPLETTR